MQKGVSVLVSTVLVVLISVVAIGAVLLVGLPAIAQFREAAVVDEAQSNMKIIDDLVGQAASEGAGVVKTAQLKVTNGFYKVNPDSESFDFNLQLQSGFLPKGTFKKIGNLLMSVTGSATASQNSTNLVIENEILKITFARVGNKTSFDGINTSTFVKTMTLKDSGTTVLPNDTSIIIAGITNTSWGLGYSELSQEGTNLPKAEVKEHVRSNTTGVEYEVLYSLPASSDFMVVSVRNVTGNKTTMNYAYKFGTNSSDVLRIANVNETTFIIAGTVTTSSASNITINLANTNSSQNSSTLNLAVGNPNLVQYNSSDNSLRNISELADIGQGIWNFITNSSATTVNYTLAGADGYEFGVRDSLPGGSYWISNDSSLYGHVNVSNDFITVGMDENNTWVYNNSGKVIFNTSFNDSVRLDGQTLTSLYGPSTQNKTLYFYDWTQQQWVIWQKGYGDDKTVASSNLAGWWKFNEGSGTLAYDSSGNNNTANITTTEPAWITNSSCRPSFGNCLSFNGNQVSNNVTVSNLSTSLTGSSFTYLMWFNTGSSSPAGKALISVGTTVADQAIDIPSSTIRGISYDTSTGTATVIGGSTSLNSNTWYQVALVRDGTSNQLRLYVNGIQDAAPVTLKGPTASYGTNPIAYIGGWVRGSFNGYLDNVKIWNTSLTPDQILAEYRDSDVPNWLDPRNKQEFRWMYSFNKQVGPSVNLTMLMTAADPFVRTFVDTQGIDFKDNYTTNTTWTQVGSNVLVNDPGFPYITKYNGAATGSDNRVYRYLGTTLSDKAWRADFEFTQNSITSAPDFCVFSVTAGSLEPCLTTNNQDAIGFLASAAGSTSLFYKDDAGVRTLQTFSFTPTNNQKYYMTLERLSETQTRITAYSDASRTTTVATVTQTIPSTIVGLNYLQHAGSSSTPAGRSLTAEIANTKIYSIQHNVTIPISIFENRTSVTTADPGLVGYWNFNEGQGNNVTDSSGNGFSGGLVNGPSWVSNSSCIFGNCLSFNGANSYVGISDNSPMDMASSGQFSVSAWINSRNIANEQFIFANDVALSQGWHLEIGSSKPLFQTYPSSSTLSSTHTLSSNAWHHVVLTYNNGAVKIYLNGTLDNSGTGYSFTTPSVAKSIGYWSSFGNYPFNGLMDDVKFYNRELSASEVAQLYQTGLNQQKPAIYFTKDNATDNEEVLFATTNFKNVNRTTPSYFNIFSNQTNFFGFNYTFNSTLNQNFMFALGTMGRMNTTNFSPQTNSSAFSGETLESIANSTTTYYDLAGITATGGTLNISGGRRIHTFTTNGTFNVTGFGYVQVLVVAGGGGGGFSTSNGGGSGGGAGGYRYDSYFPVSPGSYQVTVGSGGAGATSYTAPGTSGGNSIFSTITSYGGGGGVGFAASASGGSGGGGGPDGASPTSSNPTAGSSLGGSGNTPSTSPPQGFDGGNGGSGTGNNQGAGGGGGSSGIGGTRSGGTSGNGGPGTANSISGSSVTYAGGGGGGASNLGAAGSGGAGGGAAGGSGSGGTGASGTANTGGGGGGGGYLSGAAGSGGSGIVIVSYIDNYGPWNVTNPVSGITQHSVPQTFFYDGGAAGIWRFDEGSGLNATDASGNGNVGTLVSGPTWISNSSCMKGGCLSFDGSTNYVDINNFVWPTGDFAVETWIKPRVFGTISPTLYSRIFDFWDGSQEWQAYDVGSSYLSFNNGNPGTTGAQTISAIIQNNVWTHVVMQRRGSTYQIYMNGVMQPTTTPSGGSGLPNTNKLRIGADMCPTCSGGGVDGLFNGMIDEFKVYKRALTDAEVREHYLQGASKYYDDFGTAAGGKTYRYYGVEDSNTSLQPITPSGAVLHYRFNDNSTMNVTDSSGLGNSGGNINSVVWMSNSTCRSGFGGCMSFNGANSYINIPSNPSLNFGTGDFSIAVWAYANALGGNNELVDKNNYICNTGTGGVHPEEMGFYVNNGVPDVLGQTTLTTGKWYHLVCVRKGDNAYVYVNGLLDGSASGLAARSASGSTPLQIGAESGGTIWNGFMDEVMILNRSLSSDEVYQLYLGGAQRHGGDLVGWWKFNDNTSNNVTLDSSGNGNTGVLNGANDRVNPLWINNASCKINGCLYFRGGVFNVGGPWVDVGNSTQFDMADFTMEAWVKYNSTTDSQGTLNDQRIISRDSFGVGSNRDIFTMESTSQIVNGGLVPGGPVCYVQIRPGSTSATAAYATSTSDNTWHNIVCVRKAGVNLSIFVDGVLVNQTTDPDAGRFDGGTSMAIGAGTYLGPGASANFNGTIDNVKIWKRALTPSEVMNEYIQTQDQESIYGRIHRVASADDAQSVSYNLTAKNDTFETKDYDRRILYLNGTTSTTVSTSNSPTPACYTPSNITQYYVCSYDQSEFSPSKASGLMFSGDRANFVSECVDQTFNQTNAPYKFNVTAFGPQTSILPLTNGVCTDIGNKTSIVDSQRIPSTPFGSFSLTGPSNLLLSLQYDRIKVAGDASFSSGNYRVCVTKIGQDGQRVVINVTTC